MIVFSMLLVITYKSYLKNFCSIFEPWSTLHKSHICSTFGVVLIISIKPRLWSTYRNCSLLRSLSFRGAWSGPCCPLNACLRASPIASSNCRWNFLTRNLSATLKCIFGAFFSSSLTRFSLKVVGAVSSLSVIVRMPLTDKLLGRIAISDLKWLRGFLSKLDVDLFLESVAVYFFCSFLRSSWT